MSTTFSRLFLHQSGNVSFKFHLDKTCLFQGSNPAWYGQLNSHLTEVQGKALAEVVTLANQIEQQGGDMLEWTEHAVTTKCLIHVFMDFLINCCQLKLFKSSKAYFLRVSEPLCGFCRSKINLKVTSSPKLRFIELSTLEHRQPLLLENKTSFEYPTLSAKCINRIFILVKIYFWLVSWFILSLLLLPPGLRLLFFVVLVHFL